MSYTGQDWNIVKFNTVSDKKETNKEREINNKKKSSNQPDPEKTRLEAPKKLGQLISAGRTAKSLNQKDFANKLGISVQILSRWEANKEIPTNQNIANIEKVLGIKLPRCKKVEAKNI